MLIVAVLFPQVGLCYTKQCFFSYLFLQHLKVGRQRVFGHWVESQVLSTEPTDAEASESITRLSKANGEASDRGHS